MSIGQTVQESGAVLAGALDLGTDVADCSHTCSETGGGVRPFPGPTQP
jgi:hypothetical protein